MRHRVYGKHLGRNKNQRSALFKGLVRSLFIHESIITTETKAKAIKGLVDTLVVKGKEGSNQAKISIQGFLPEKEISKKLLTEIAPRYKKRTSGFTGLVKLGRRAGDGAMMVKMSLMDGEAVKSLKADESKEAVIRTEKTEVKKEAKKEIKKEVKTKTAAKKETKAPKKVKK